MTHGWYTKARKRNLVVGKKILRKSTLLDELTVPLVKASVDPVALRIENSQYGRCLAKNGLILRPMLQWLIQC